MKLQQILSNVFPRISRSKSEKSGSECDRQNRHRSKSDRREETVVGDLAPRPSACRSVHLEGRTEDSAGESDATTPKLIQTFCYENFDDDDDGAFESNAEQTPVAVTSSFSYYYYDDDDGGGGGDNDYGKTDFKEGSDGVEETQPLEEDRRNSPIFHWDATATVSPANPRRKIRTNPWLQSPTSPRQYVDGYFDVLPSSTADRRSPSTSGLTPVDVGFPTSIADRLLLLLLLLPPPLANDNESSLQKPTPAWAVDSGSEEGYATSLIRSPSSTDLECASVDDRVGRDDSALASSVSSESDLYWIDRSPEVEFDLRSKVSTAMQHPSGERSVETEGDAEEIFDNRSEPRNATETAISNEERISTRSSALLKLSSACVDASRENNADTSFELPLANISGSSQKVAPSGEEEQEEEEVVVVVREDPAGHVPSTDANCAERSFELNPYYSDQDCELKPVDDDDDDDDKLVTTRSLVEVSRSLQEKVETLHEQKYYVDAVFMRARQLDSQREAELARFRAQLTAKKRQTMLQRLQELKETLASQSIRIQSIYDTILWKQWPRRSS